MTADLEPTVLREAKADRGFVGGLAVTERLVVAVGGTSSRAPAVLASSDARHFEPRTTPRQLGLRHVLAIGDALWTCGEYGQLAVSADTGATWKLVETGTEACLFGLARAPDGSIWVVGDGGFAARVTGGQLERVDLATSVRLAAVYAIGDELVVLGGDGAIRRWRGGQTTPAATGSAGPLSALAITRHGTWVVVGDGGFVARSPDGGWFTRVRAGVDVDLEGVTVLADGRLVAVGDHGQALVSSDDARTWTAVPGLPAVHLWTVERFGAGALIGGDGGLVLRLAPPDDTTWQDRADVFGATRPLDAVFRRGPDRFVADGLAGYVAVQPSGPAPAPPHEKPGHDRDRTLLPLAAPGDASSFERAYGVRLPGDVARLFELARARPTALAGLELDARLLPEVGDDNLFELLVCRDQHGAPATGLVEAFSGVFAIGSHPAGDSYHLELYEWDGPRQVLRYDHDRGAFAGVVADSVDSLVYAAALARAREREAISDEAFDAAVHALRGRIAPGGPLAIGELDPGFVELDARRRDTEFFFYRARWICGWLAPGAAGGVADIPASFDANFNQVVPFEQLPARFEACERLIPTALYAMWRAYLFDEPELARYLELGRAHRARIVRDAARSIDELCAGRNELGTIRDVRAHLAEFRALDLDPRRARERATEAQARVRRDATRWRDATGELARTPRAGWAELAWRWLDDGVAHRALLEQLGRRPEIARQLAVLAELHRLPAADRRAALRELAGQLAPELEAVLVGSLVRDDSLTHPGTGDPDAAPGWDAIDRALAPIYGGAEPHAHFGTAVPYHLGGNDPLHGISVYLRDEPVPHFHFVTYGFTDLFAKELAEPEVSGFGFELSLRIARRHDDRDVPDWALAFLQNLGRYVFGTGNRFDIGHKMGLHGPMVAGGDSRLTAILFADDAELGAIDSPFGRARFLEVVGITDDEYRLIQEWSTDGLVGLLRAQLPLLVTDLARASILDDEAVAQEVRARVAAEGSSEDLTFAGDLAFERDGERIRITMGALYAAALPRAMRGRLRHGRPYTMRGRSAILHLEPGEVARCEGSGEELVVALPPALAAEVEVALRDGLAGTYQFEAWTGLELAITPSFIRDQQGLAIEVRGIADPEEATRMLEAENAESADHADSADSADSAASGDDGEELDDDGPGPDARGRIRAALALGERALALAPSDEDVQFTVALLLVDADRMGLPGSADVLVATLPRLALRVRLQVAMRLAGLRHPRFAEALELVTSSPTGSLEIGDQALTRLAEAALELAPDRVPALLPHLRPSIAALWRLAMRAGQMQRRAQEIAIYERLLALPVPEDGRDRALYLRALHAAACAHAAAGDHAKAFEHVKRAVEHDYIHVPRIAVDRALGPILEWPEFKALVRTWRARQEGNG